MFVLGSSMARMVRPSVDWMFGVVAEPMGVLVCGLLVTGRWKWVAAIYGVMVSSYFVHPFGRLFPLWTILDILVALVLIYPVSRVSKHVYAADVATSSRAVVLVAFVGTWPIRSPACFCWSRSGCISSFTGHSTSYTTACSSQERLARTLRT